MELVKVKTKYQITLPAAVRRKIGVNIGDIFEAGHLKPIRKSLVFCMKLQKNIKQNRKLSPMNTRLTPKAVKSYAEAPKDVQRAFDKQTKLLIGNIRHPSLHAKKYNEAANVWQARVNQDWRFYFIIQNDTYIIIDLSKHPK